MTFVPDSTPVVLTIGLLFVACVPTVVGWTLIAVRTAAHIRHLLKG